jgi:hypothetical protein
MYIGRSIRSRPGGFISRISADVRVQALSDLIAKRVGQPRAEGAEAIVEAGASRTVVVALNPRFLAVGGSSAYSACSTATTPNSSLCGQLGGKDNGPGR